MYEVIQIILSPHAVLPSVGISKQLSTEVKVSQSLPKIKQKKAEEAVGMPTIIFHRPMQ